MDWAGNSVKVSTYAILTYVQKLRGGGGETCNFVEREVVIVIMNITLSNCFPPSVRRWEGSI